MLITIVILSLVLIRSIFVSALDKRLIKHQQTLVEGYKKVSEKQIEAHKKFVSDYFTMYCAHQKDLLMHLKRLAEKHSDESAEAGINLALIELARLKEIHLDKYIETESEHV